MSDPELFGRYWLLPRLILGLIVVPGWALWEWWTR